MRAEEKRYMNIDGAVKDHLCLGCGMCYAACPQEAIDISVRCGLYLPSVDKKKCNSNKGCELCLKVCPGIGANIDQESNVLFPNLESDLYLGRYQNCYTSHSTNHDIRYHSASGGVATQLLIDMLERGVIQGALVARMKEDDPLMPDVILATTKKELIQSQSSKYCPVPTCRGLKNLLKEKGRFAVVGLPCHIQAFRKAEKMFPGLSEKVYAYLGIYCSSTKNFQATEYLLNICGISPANIGRFFYRDDGCLGDMKVELKSGEIKRFPYKEYYPKIRSFFIPYRCTLCIEHVAELADISIGDIHIPEFWNDKVGTSSVIIRSKRGAQIFNESVQNGSLTAKELDPALLIKSQRGMLLRKKFHVVVRFAFLKLFGKTIPSYDFVFPRLSLKLRAKYFISTIILYAEILIGKQKPLWFLMAQIDKVLDKK